MNAEYIRTMPIDELLPMVKAELRANKLWREEYDDDDREWFERTVDLIRQRFFTLKDFSSQGRAYFSSDFDFEESAVKKNLTQGAATSRIACRRLLLSWKQRARSTQKRLRQLYERLRMKPVSRQVY